MVTLWYSIIPVAHLRYFSIYVYVCPQKLRIIKRAHIDINTNAVLFKKITKLNAKTNAVPKRRQTL